MLNEEILPLILCRVGFPFLADTLDLLENKGILKQILG